MTSAERCQHPDCIYRNRFDPEKTGNCNYCGMMGQSRTAGLPEELKDPAKCPRYISNGKTPETPKRDWREDAAALYADGKTDREIAEALGKYVQQVQNWRWNIMRRPPNPPAPGHRAIYDWKRAEELYRRGMNDCQIARELGCTFSSVKRWRYKRGLLPNTKKGRKANED